MCVWEGWALCLEWTRKENGLAPPVVAQWNVLSGLLGRRRPSICRQHLFCYTGEHCCLSLWPKCGLRQMQRSVRGAAVPRSVECWIIAEHLHSWTLVITQTAPWSPVQADRNTGRGIGIYILTPLSAVELVIYDIRGALVTCRYRISYRR